MFPMWKRPQETIIQSRQNTCPHLQIRINYSCEEKKELSSCPLLPKGFKFKKKKHHFPPFAFLHLVLQKSSTTSGYQHLFNCMFYNTFEVFSHLPSTTRKKCRNNCGSCNINIPGLSDMHCCSWSSYNLKCLSSHVIAKKHLPCWQANKKSRNCDDLCQTFQL